MNDTGFRTGTDRRESTRRAATRLENLARLLDSSIGVPGTRFSFGLDSILSIVPVVGSFMGAGISAYVILEAYRLGAPRATLAKMLANIGLDTALGAIPVVGFVFDAFYKANNRNVALLRRYLAAANRI
ncbi:DUF4112 domain-containing protein [Salinarimonas ramus]|uniref:DUF4112 domain-containing protein n=1 Tax=Salinarimonas ramus TaxID=690164 RepID=A0A917QCN5_9HYPH|nr:DUF4112 domain-containing protein [Salinarimonas ramus]GGK44277.1 hypothetical protein GCM10011322_34280 [Salinarimonas ramus]